MENVLKHKKPEKFSELRLKLLNPPSLQLLSDIIALILSYSIHYFFRFETELFETSSKPDLSVFISSCTVLLIYWLIVFWFSGFYKNWYIRSPFDELFAVIRTCFIGTFILFFFVFLDSGSQSPRMLILAYFLLVSFFVETGRFISRRIQKKMREKRIFQVPALVIGQLKDVQELIGKTQHSPAWGYVPIGYLLFDQHEIHKIKNKETPFLGLIDDFDLILEEQKPKEVLIAAQSPDRNLLLKITAKCAEKNVTVNIVPDMYDMFTGQARTLSIYGIPLIEINTKLLRPWEEFIKRTIDLVFSSLVILLGLPFWILLAIIQKIESRGPVFYKQERVGKDSKSFLIYKFRSMVQDAERHGPQWASVNDPRVTRFGKFLRSSHLDEIPQFWNVLKGEMSLVGPRPERPHFVEKFSALIPYYKRRLVVRPGITGWWQVNYTTYVESIEEIENRLKDDFYYIENMSLKLDIEIIIRTVFLVIKGHGQT